MTSNSNEENSRQRQSVPDNDPFLLPPLWVTRLHCRQKRSSQHTQKRKKSETEDHFILTALPARTTGVFQAIERKRGEKRTLFPPRKLRGKASRRGTLRDSACAVEREREAGRGKAASFTAAEPKCEEGESPLPFYLPHGNPSWMITEPNDDDDDYNGEAAAADDNDDDDDGRCR